VTHFKDLRKEGKYFTLFVDEKNKEDRMEEITRQATADDIPAIARFLGEGYFTGEPWVVGTIRMINLTSADTEWWVTMTANKVIGLDRVEDGKWKTLNPVERRSSKRRRWGHDPQIWKDRLASKLHIEPGAYSSYRVFKEATPRLQCALLEEL
jgi:hypothetical protein